MKSVKVAATGSAMPRFEDTATGRMKRQIWDASDKEIYCR